MKRSLIDTERKVRIVIDHSSHDGWSAVAAVDDTIGFDRIRGTSARDVLITMQVQLEESGALDDRPVPIPEQDYELVCAMLRGIAAPWIEPRHIPSWRTNEYIRGQIELVIETCRVVNDDEYERVDVDTDRQRDRIIDWLRAEVWK